MKIHLSIRLLAAFGTALAVQLAGAQAPAPRPPSAGGAPAVAVQHAKFEVLHVFQGPEGTGPSGRLTLGPDGAMYGTTSSGGITWTPHAPGLGNVFRIDASGTVTSLYDFVDVAQGYSPADGLTLARDGDFYGVTTLGGAYGAGGSVFRLSPAGEFTVLHGFDGVTPGEPSYPRGPLLQASDGAFYGATFYGGAHDVGTLFRMDAAGVVTYLHSFDAAVDGWLPKGPLLEASDGQLYGVNSAGGGSNAGVLYRATFQGEVTVIHSFNGTDGAEPSSVIQARDGLLYGVTTVGGRGDGGVAFRVALDGTGFTVLHEFVQDGVDGIFPEAPLIQAADGLFYGTTEGGGHDMDCLNAYGCGTVFRMDVDGTVVRLHSFARNAKGQVPVAPLLAGPHGWLYGSTAGDWLFGMQGSLFRIGRP